MERCPDRHLTLVKAKVGNKDDHEYYRQYCKEGVKFAELVRRQIVVLLPCSRRLKMLYSGVLFSLMQSPPEIMKDGLCPAMLMPSKACKEMSTNETWFCFEAKTSAVNMDHLLPPTTVTRRCLPALGTLKGGVVVVGNETILDAGEGTTVQASDVLEASK